MSETDGNDATRGSESSIHRETGLGYREYQLMGFAVALAQLVVAGTPWLTVGGGDAKIYSGITLILARVDSRPPVDGVGPVMMLVYLVLVVAALVRPPQTRFAVLRPLAGLVATILVMHDVGSSERYVRDWTGAQLVALALWVIAMLIAAVAPSTRSTTT